MPSAVPNYHPYHGSMMSYSSQAPSYSSAPMGNETNTSVGATEFPEFSTQMALGGMSNVHETIPNEEDSTPARPRSSKWTTEQNLVLLSGWIKYGTDSVVDRNQKGDSYWGKIAEYCNEHGSFDTPRDGVSCRNHYNYVNKSLGKWVGAYDNAKRMQRSGWSEDDVLAKAHELYSSAGNGNFKYIKEWLAIRDQPRYGSQVGGNTGSGSSGSKRAHESDASDTNSVGSSTRPMGRDAAKKKAKKKGKGAALEVVNEEWNEFKQLKMQELARLNNIAMLQRETNELIKEKTQAKKMKMYLKLTEKEHLDDKGKELLQKLSHDLFGN
ncbi:unnamed protein product [Arabidopsis arenosa]|uniref:Myb-like domain-containing protein n=1 Tax=Arabidopsis arenosa TaxID=38785 RepID=A0A8S2A2X3_ARAAE|nr:unnamed protein product [Arabidopsis arenosa]